jgi:hypothetical protein
LPSPPKKDDPSFAEEAPPKERDLSAVAFDIPQRQSSAKADLESEPVPEKRPSEIPMGMRVSDIGPGASVKEIAKNMNFGMMGGMSLTQKKLMERKLKEEEIERKR